MIAADEELQESHASNKEVTRQTSHTSRKSRVKQESHASNTSCVMEGLGMWGFEVQGLEFRVGARSLNFRVCNLGFRVWGSGFGVWGLGSYCSDFQTAGHYSCGGSEEAPARIQKLFVVEWN